MRMEKVKSRAGLAGRLRHNTREHLAPNIDPDRVQDNLLIGGTANNVMKDFSGRLPEAVRKNAVLAVEVLMTASRDFSGDWKKYLDDCDKWAAGVFGKENVLSIAHHLDETTPHTQIIVMPIKDGKLNAKHFIGGTRDRMAELQNDFHKRVGQPAGLDRGKPRSETRARHTPHTLAGSAAELEKKKKILEAAINETKINPVEIREMKNRLANLDSQTPDSLRSYASMLETKGFKTVGEYRKAVEARQEKQQQQKNIRSFSH
jgi:hypothetical protein